MFHTWGRWHRDLSSEQGMSSLYISFANWIKTVNNMIMALWLIYTHTPLLLPVITFHPVAIHNISTLQQPGRSRAQKSPTKGSLFLLHSNIFKHNPPVKSSQVGWQLYPADFPSAPAWEQLGLVQPAFNSPVGKAVVIRGGMNDHGAKPAGG